MPESDLPTFDRVSREGRMRPNARTRGVIPVVRFGISLSIFFVVTYVLCVLFDLWFPGLAMYPVWSPLLPGFTWLSWPSFFLGLAETAGYAWYIALVFGPIYNYCVAFRRSESNT